MKGDEGASLSLTLAGIWRSIAWSLFGAFGANSYREIIVFQWSESLYKEELGTQLKRANYLIPWVVRLGIRGFS
jgi:hypothetical protein